MTSPFANTEPSMRMDRSCRRKKSAWQNSTSLVRTKPPIRTDTTTVCPQQPRLERASSSSSSLGESTTMKPPLWCKRGFGIRNDLCVVLCSNSRVEVKPHSIISKAVNNNSRPSIRGSRIQDCARAHHHDQDSRLARPPKSGEASSDERKRPNPNPNPRQESEKRIHLGASLVLVVCSRRYNSVRVQWFG